MLVSEYLLGRGCCPSLIMSVLSMQMYLEVYFKAASSIFLVIVRTKGSLTGTRVAVLMSRVPMAHTLHAKKSEISRHPHPGGVSGSAWSDDIYVLGLTAQDMISLSDNIHDFLAENWDLHIKPDSRECLVCP